MIVFIGGAAFGTTAIPVAYWGISIALGAGGLLVGMLARLIPDAPIGQFLIKLGVMPNIDALPRTRTRKETGETGDEKVHRCASSSLKWRIELCLMCDFSCSQSCTLCEAVVSKPTRIFISIRRSSRPVAISMMMTVTWPRDFVRFPFFTIVRRESQTNRFCYQSCYLR